MFTGLIERIGIVRRLSRGRGLVVEIESSEPWSEPLVEGESIAVNGVCLTVARCAASRFTADILGETESRTTLGSLAPGDRVDLERALKAGDRLGGHLVQGHVDTVGTLIAKEPRGRDWHLRVRCGRVVAAQSVLKGSIALDGVSLTISEIGDDFIGVDVIPTTMKDTVFSFRRVGDRINIEGDIVGKYIARSRPETALTEEKLINAGFMS